MRHSQCTTEDAMLRVKLAAAKAELAKLTEEVAKIKAEKHMATIYTPWDQIPPPTPQEQKDFRLRLSALIETIESEGIAEKRDWLLRFVDDWP